MAKTVNDSLFDAHDRLRSHQEEVQKSQAKKRKRGGSRDFGVLRQSPLQPNNRKPELSSGRTVASRGLGTPSQLLDPVEHPDGTPKDSLKDPTFTAREAKTFVGVVAVAALLATAVAGNLGPEVDESNGSGGQGSVTAVTPGQDGQP